MLTKFQWYARDGYNSSRGSECNAAFQELLDRVSALEAAVAKPESCDCWQFGPPSSVTINGDPCVWIREAELAELRAAADEGVRIKAAVERFIRCVHSDGDGDIDWATLPELLKGIDNAMDGYRNTAAENQAAAETLERLKRGNSLEESGRTYRLFDVETSYATARCDTEVVRADRDALAAKVQQKTEELEMMANEVAGLTKQRDYHRRHRLILAADLEALARGTRVETALAEAVQDKIEDLIDEKAELARERKAAILAMSNELQPGGRHSRLVQAGQSLSTDGPRILGDEIDRLQVEKANLAGRIWLQQQAHDCLGRSVVELQNHKADLEKRLVDETESEFKRGVAEGRSAQAIVEIHGRERFMADLRKEYPTPDELAADRRDAERFREAERRVTSVTTYAPNMHTFMVTLSRSGFAAGLDAAIAASKTPDKTVVEKAREDATAGRGSTIDEILMDNPEPPKCPRCGSDNIGESLIFVAHWRCKTCDHCWSKESKPDHPRCLPVQVTDAGEPEPPKCPQCGEPPVGACCKDHWHCKGGHIWPKEPKP